MAGKNERTSSGRIVGCLVFVIVLLLVALAALAFYVYWQAGVATRAAAEENAYECLEESHSSEDFRSFVRRYPDSKFLPDVIIRMEAMGLMERCWDDLEGRSAKAEDYKKFAERFDNAYYDALAMARIDSLDWLRAKEQDDAAAYEKYLSSHPDGEHFAEATLVHRQCLGTEPSADEFADVLVAVENFLNVVAKGDGSAAKSLVSAAVKSFLGHRDVDAAAVARSIAGMFSKHILSCSFTLGDDFKVRRERSGGGYAVHASVEQSIKRDNAGKTAGKYILNASLDKDFRITSFEMTETSRETKDSKIQKK